MLLNIELIKKHLNIDEYYEDDDNYLAYLCEVAEKTVEKHIDTDLGSLISEYGELPAPIAHAILLFIGDMYKSRESVSFGSVTSIPFSSFFLLLVFGLPLFLFFLTFFGFLVNHIFLLIFHILL